MRNYSDPLHQRAAGLLLHPTSLPGPHGCGDLGPAAFEFVDFLAAGGLRWWQMLPVHPPGPGNSPYSADSAFAGSPLLVSIDVLVRDGLLQRGEIRPPAAIRHSRVNYPAVRKYRDRLLRRAFAAFRGSSRRIADYADFQRRAAAWLSDYTLFCALRRRHGADWTRWPAPLRGRRERACTAAREALRDEVAFHEFVQFIFDRQWNALRAYCRRKGVALLGDVPIFVAHRSGDVWAQQELFELERDGRLRLQSGVPPDDFSRTGQLWRHPLYRWPRHRATGYAWWIERFRAALAQFDAVRVDHFLGFHQCWAVPGGDPTAEHGRYLATPGYELFGRLRKALGDMPIIAEDLGAVTSEALELRDRLGFPGMRILHWAFGAGPGARYNQPHNYPRRCVVYSGTHDNNTTLGWWRSLRHGRTAAARSLGRAARQRLRAYCNSTGRAPHWDLTRLAFASPADTAIVPVQDVLGLDERARMNLPSTGRGNWEWRMPPAALTPQLARRIRSLTETYERVPPPAK
jgi:4-alpha-glucanotransferase